MATYTTNFRNYVTSNFNQGQGNNYDLIFPIWFTETNWHDNIASSKAAPNGETDSHHRGQNTIYFELDYPGTEITSCRMVVWCDNAVRVLQQSDGEGTGYSQGNGRLLLTNAGMANTETGHFTLKNGKNRFIFEVANNGDTHGGPGYLLACAVTSDGTNNNLIFNTGYNFCKWGGYTSTSNSTYDSLGQGWKWKNGFFSNTSAPVLSGVPSNTTITDQDSYTIPTVTATDTTDGTLSVTVNNGGYTTSGTSSHTIGNYTITFTATDSNLITTTASYVLTVESSQAYFNANVYAKTLIQLVGAGGTSNANTRMNRGVYRYGIVYLKDTYDPAAHQSQGVNYDWTSHELYKNSTERIVSGGAIGGHYWYGNHSCTSHYPWFSGLGTATNNPISGIRYIMYLGYVAGVQNTDGQTFDGNQVDQVWETAYRADYYDTTENTNTLNVFTFGDNSTNQFYKRLSGTNNNPSYVYPKRKCYVYVIEAKTNGGGTRLYNRSRYMKLYIISKPCSSTNAADGIGSASGNGETLTRVDGTDLTHYY